MVLILLLEGQQNSNQLNQNTYSASKMSKAKSIQKIYLILPANSTIKKKRHIHMYQLMKKALPSTQNLIINTRRTKKRKNKFVNRSIKIQQSEELILSVFQQNYPSFDSLWMQFSCSAIIYAIHIQSTFISKRGSKMQSAWFQEGKMHCFAEWIAYLFDLQITDAYGKKTKNKFEAYQFAKHLYQSQQFQKILRQCVKKFCNKKEKSQQQVGQENFYFTQTLVRIKQSQNPVENLLEYDWKLENASPYHQILLLLAQDIELKLSEYQENKWISEVQAIKSKTKKKHHKKKIKKNIQLQRNVGENNNESRSKSKQQQVNLQLNKQFAPQKLYIQQQQKLQTQFKQQQNTHNKYNNKQQNPKQEENTCNIYDKYKKVQTNTPHATDKQQIYYENVIANKHNSEYKKNLQKNQKLVIKKINEHLQLFAINLLQSGNNQNHFKESAVLQINQALAQMNLKTQWQIKVYGSSAIGFALKQSDIDLLLIANEMNISFQEVFIQLKNKKWVFDCQFIKTAYVPIIKFRVHLVGLDTIQMSNKQIKKKQNTFFSVDLTMCSRENISQGIANTNYMKQLFDKYANVQKTAIIIKYYLRKKGLNHPFKGGINSFTIVVLIYGILRQKNMLNNSSIYKEILTILEFMTVEFQPFNTIIRTKNNKLIGEKISELEYKSNSSLEQSTLHLKIQNPIQQGFLKTSAFKIDDIILCLDNMKHLLLDLKSELCNQNINERKKIKKIILSSFDKCFNNNQQQGMQEN